MIDFFDIIKAKSYQRFVYFSDTHNLFTKLVRRLLALFFFLKGDIPQEDFVDAILPTTKQSIALAKWYHLENLKADCFSIYGHKMRFDRKPIFDYNYLFWFSDIVVKDQYHAKDYLESDSVIFDIGANVGAFSVYAHQLCRKGKIYAFEPASETFQLLKENLSGLKNTIPVQAALGSRRGSAYLGIAGGSVSNSITTTKFYKQNGVTYFGREKIKITSIDHFVATNRIKKLDFIKIDTEGSERAVIRGGRKTIKKFHPVIAISAYHLTDDKEKIPQMIKQIYPGYQYFLSNRGEQDFIFYDENHSHCRKFR